MKKISVAVFAIFAAIFLGSCSGEKKEGGSAAATSKLPTMTLLDSATFDFGTISEGAIVEHTFRFKNDGAYPLIINNISSSCGCTTPEWPKEPVGPGTSSNIKVRFDSKHKAGPQSKTITVYANTEPSVSELRLKGIVNAVAKADSAK